MKLSISIKALVVGAGLCAAAVIGVPAQAAPYYGGKGCWTNLEGPVAGTSETGYFIDGQIVHAVSPECQYPWGGELEVAAAFNAPLEQFLDNFIDPLPIKHMRIEVTAQIACENTPEGLICAQPDAGSLTIDVHDAFDSGLGGLATPIQISHEFVCSQFTCTYVDFWDIIPNPDNEIVSITWSQDFTQATFAAIDTISTPEPGSLALIGLGLAGVGVIARRRRRA